MWRIAGDDTPPVLTAEGNIQSGHGERITLELPKTAIVFFMGKATEYLAEKYGCAMLTDRFPRFLKVCPIYRFKEHEICFLNGGSGAPPSESKISSEYQASFLISDTIPTRDGYTFKGWADSPYEKPKYLRADGYYWYCNVVNGPLYRVSGSTWG